MCRGFDPVDSKNNKDLRPQGKIITSLDRTPPLTYVAAIQCSIRGGFAAQFRGLVENETPYSHDHGHRDHPPVYILAVNRLGWIDSSDFLTSLDLRWLHAKFRMRGEMAPGNEVVIVGLDERTTAALGSARVFGRHHAATLVDQIAAAGARVIGFDILYPDADVSDPENDLRFAESVERAGNVIMGVHLDLKSTTGAQEEREELSPELQDLVIEKQVYPAVRQSGTSQGGTRIQGANLSMNRPELNRAAASFGFVNFHPDAQGFLRYQPQFIEWGGHLYPSLVACNS